MSLATESVELEEAEYTIEVEGKECPGCGLRCIPWDELPEDAEVGASCNGGAQIYYERAIGHLVQIVVKFEEAA